MTEIAPKRRRMILAAVLEIGAWYWRFGEERFQMPSERFLSKAATGDGRLAVRVRAPASRGRALDARRFARLLVDLI